jgi:hypothetical protein
VRFGLLPVSEVAGTWLLARVQDRTGSRAPLIAGIVLNLLSRTALFSSHCRPDRQDKKVLLADRLGSIVDPLFADANLYTLNLNQRVLALSL